MTDTHHTPALAPGRPKVSVVITCFNLGEYLPEALDSISLYVGPAEVEVIIVNAGSTDGRTVEVLAGLDRSRYTIVDQANMGLANARNNGIARANGTYIMSRDADNRIRPEFLERSIEILDNGPEVGVVFGDHMYFGAREGRRKVGAYGFERLVRMNYIDACACYRRSVWEQVGGYDEHMPHMGWEDWDFWLRCSVAGVTFRYVEEVFFDYRVREGSMIAGTLAHEKELTAYIFAKPQLRFLAAMRRHYLQLLHAAQQQPADRELVRILLARLRGKLRRSTGGSGPTEA